MRNVTILLPCELFHLHIFISFWQNKVYRLLRVLTCPSHPEIIMEMYQIGNREPELQLCQTSA